MGYDEIYSEKCNRRDQDVTYKLEYTFYFEWPEYGNLFWCGFRACDNWNIWVKEVNWVVTDSKCPKTLEYEK